MKILISCGHGGTDPGVTGYTGVPEHALTCTQGNLIAKYLKAEGHTVKVCIEEWSANNFRVRSRKGCDVAVSLHFNGFNGKANGTEVLYSNYTSVASRVLRAINSTLGLSNRGLKKRSDLYVFWHNNFDCLIETCFIDNKHDYDTYKAKQEEVAKAIAYAIINKPMSKPYGWEQHGNHWYYRQSDGTLAKDRLGYVGSDFYYFDKQGRRGGGVFKVNGRYYHFSNETGKAVQGWYTTKDGKKMYFDRDGKSAVGLVYIGKDQYCFDKNGFLKIGKFKATLITDSDGKVVKGC